MIGYDFDKTISFHDSTKKFYFFCIKKKQHLAILPFVVLV